MKYTTVQVDVSLSDFEIDDIIDELESEGYTVLNEDELYENRLTDSECDYICDLLSRAKPGDMAYNIREKLRKK